MLKIHDYDFIYLKEVNVSGYLFSRDFPAVSCSFLRKFVSAKFVLSSLKINPREIFVNVVIYSDFSLKKSKYAFQRFELRVTADYIDLEQFS